MHCAVCHNARARGMCAVCGFDNDAAEARDPAVVAQRRQAFRATSLQPRVKIGPFDKLRPWLGLLLGFFLFATWWKACDAPGWPFW